jgi:hypothetical protein
VIDAFCFTNDLFLTERRLFLGKPDLKAIKKAFVNKGVQVVDAKHVNSKPLM